MSEFLYAATCLFGLERLVGETVDALGYRRRETIDGRVYFWGDESAVARCNINFRCAERLLLVIGEFDAPTFDALFEGTLALPWENFIGENDVFPVSGHSIRSKLFSIPDCQKIVKKAIVERLKRRYKKERFEENDRLCRIEFFILDDKAALMIDTSGDPLYKRGYRTAANDAPIRETLAAALVNLARIRHDVLLWDPMCGSGTLPIEAALSLANIAPGINRSFAAENFRWLDQSIWQRARNEARENIKDIPFEIYGSDVDGAVIEIAKENAKRAGVADKIKFFECDVANITPPVGRRGTFICNPPYGERLLDVNEAEKLYRIMGKVFKKFEGWQSYIITSNEYFEKHFGLPADKKRKMYNGMLKCNYYQYYKRRK